MFSSGLTVFQFDMGLFLNFFLLFLAQHGDGIPVLHFGNIVARVIDQYPAKYWRHDQALQYRLDKLTSPLIESYTISVHTQLVQKIMT